MTDFHPKRDEFFYIKVSDKQTNRDNKLSELFGGTYITTYLGANRKSVDKIYLARFWKDKGAAQRAMSDMMKVNLPIILEMCSMGRVEFIKSIPDKIDFHDYIFFKNLKLKEEEVPYLKKETKFLSQYKAISSYRFPNNWFNYLPCPNCGLRPLVWEFNNGRSTACGCGENEYNHFSIKAESIMSYVKRNGGSALGYLGCELEMNWNQWVKTKQVVFEPGGDRW